MGKLKLFCKATVEIVHTTIRLEYPPPSKASMGPKSYVVYYLTKCIDCRSIEYELLQSCSHTTNK